MKILMVSMPSLHFFRWTDQLKESGHEVYWFDITGAGEKAERINWVRQIVDWKLKYDFPGRYFVKNKLPKVYKWLQQYNERDTEMVFEDYLQEIQPDVVHSFALYISCTPIIEVMKKYSNQKWIYSSWGSDLFYFQNNPKYLKDIQNVLPRVNYLFTDCLRDFGIAKRHGFVGEFLGVFPGGGGFDYTLMEHYKQPIEERKIILIKGYQGRSGRVIPVLKAIELLKAQLIDYKLVAFGADAEVFDYIKQSPLQNWSNFQVKGKISQQEVWQLMGESIIYIGNSNSDGIPNTLLEAICMEVFPIQSNPGEATEEIIENKYSGLLIQDSEDVLGIKEVIIIVLNDSSLIKKGVNYNLHFIIPRLEYYFVKDEVLKKYDLIEKSIIK
jgi:glycosyltransferase involved in cell wall biosynthesis